jgi:hypothetical protein
MLRFFRKKSGPPSPSDVMSRAVVLQCQIVLGMTIPPPELIADVMTEWSPEDRERLLAQQRRRQTDLKDLFQRTGLWSAMTLAERATVTAAPGEIDPQTHRNLSWLMESAACLLWALGYVEQLPPYDTQSDIEDLKKVQPDDVEEAIRTASLREAKVISKARDIAELWHWRSRTRQLQESGQTVSLPNEMTLTDIVRMAAEAGAKDGLFERAIDGDFPVRGRAYAQLTADEWSEVRSIAMERHKALNWLCGYAPGNDWDKTPTHT